MSLPGGHKDALCYKFRRPTIDENCSAVCAQTRPGWPKAIDMHSRKNGTKCRTFREACSASSEARDEVCSLLCSGGRFDV